MKRTIPFLCLLLILNTSGTELGGLILFSVDTISTKNQYGFDFVTQKSCTVGVNSAPYSCLNHFTFIFDPSTTTYIFAPDNEDGPAYCINMGKMNLDSIKAAFADSVFLKQPNGHGDDIPVDSLSSRVGNVYLLETAPDPRPAWAGVFFAKMKILGFDVIDSASHQIKMRFLWACQLSHARDLTTSGLDTFHLGTTGINRPNSQIPSNISHTTNNQYVFKVVGDRFVLPRELVGKVKSVTVWDLRGRMVGRLAKGNGKDINLSRFAKGRKIIMVKMER